MRVLLLPWSQPTHYLPMVPLAWALRAAGHDVRVACQPHSAEAVRRSGLAVTTVGHDYDYLAGFQQIHEEFLRYKRENPNRTVTLESRAALPLEARRKALATRSAPFVKTAEAMAEELVALSSRWRPDLVIANPFVMAAPLAARAAGAPLAVHLTGPAVERQMSIFPMSGAVPEIWPNDLVSLFGRFDTPVQAEYATRTVDPCPPILQYPGIPNRLGVRFVPYNGPGDAPSWLDEQPRRPRVCVTWGTTTTQLAGSAGFLVPEILAALDGFQDVEVVVAVSAADRELLPESTDRVRVVTALPLHLLMPSCDAIVHQGGTGTMFTAAAAGVPQVMIAAMPDQVATAARVQAVGASVTVEPEAVSPATVAAAVSSALRDETVRKSAAALQQEIQAQPTPAQVAETLAGAAAH